MKSKLNELSKKTRSNYLIKRMNQYMDDKFEGKKKEKVKNTLNKTFKKTFGKPRPDNKGRVRDMGESINYRMARILIEAYLEERGYAGKGPGGQNWRGIYRRLKSGEGTRRPSKRLGSTVDGGTSSDGGPVSKVTRGVLKAGVNDQNATGKGNKAKRRMAKGK